MRCFTVAFFVFCLCLDISAQLREGRYEFGPDAVRVLLVQDAASPLQLRERPRVFGYKSGAVKSEYIVQNVSDSNVVSFAIEQIDWLGSTGYGSQAEIKDTWMFGPTITYSSIDDSPPFQIIPPDADAITKTKRRSLFNGLLILMVTKAKLANGKAYDASANFKALSNFLLESDWEFRSAAEIENRQRSVREYVATMFK